MFPQAEQPAVPAVAPDLLGQLNAEFAEKGEISQETLQALKGNPNLPAGFDQYVATYAMLAANRRTDNREAAQSQWGANAPAVSTWIESRPDLGVAILTAPNAAAARLAAQSALAQFAQSNSTAPAGHITSTGSGGAPAIPAGVPKNAQEKARLVSNPRFLYDVAYMNQALAAIDKGQQLGIKYE
jgi:hypothetical protein